MKRVFLFFVLSASLTLFNAGQAGAESNFELVTVAGNVQMQEVGGKGLYIFSIWNGNKKSFVDGQGKFSVQILANSHPQKLSVRDDQGKTRALALIFSQGANPVIFDARSTALAVVLGDPDLVKDSAGMDKISRLASTKASFQEFVLFFKKNLPLKNLEALSHDPAYVDLFEACNREIFHEDRAVIKRSLRDAQGKLEELLK